MTIGSSTRIFPWMVTAALLVVPAAAHGHSFARALQTPVEQNQIAEQQRLAEIDEAKQSRDQERRDREEELRDREQEKADRAQERAERLEELYDEGRDALEEDRFDNAAAKFHELEAMNGPQSDAALYWKAYAENRLGKRDVALATLGSLKQRYPQSRWSKDAAALEIEVRQSNGQAPHPEAQNDQELRMLAIEGLMNSDPERALPLLEKDLSGTAPMREKAKALFVIAQSGSPKARDMLANIARGNGNPELQRKAIEYLALFGGGEAREKNGGSAADTLAQIYASTTDDSIKRTILKSYMIAGDKNHLFEIAKNEKNDGLKREAIRQLGLTGAENELNQLYAGDISVEIRKELLQAFFLAGDAGRIANVAQSEQNPVLRRAAIRNLGMMNSPDGNKTLHAIYAKDSDRETREEVLNAFFIEGNATDLIAIAKAEKDPELKKAAVQKLSVMGSKEATDYLMEILQK